MGLDMYIHRKNNMYRLKDGTFTDGKGKEFNEYYNEDEFGCSNSVEISENVCYWRKANSIHNWFVNNVQHGEDDCREYYVDVDTLKELYDTCIEVLKGFEGKEFFIPVKESDENGKEKTTKTDVFEFEFGKDYERIYNYEIDLGNDEKLLNLIKDKLEPCEGFFFGDTGLNGGYVYDLMKTVKMLTRLFENNEEAAKKKLFFDYYYQSSW